MPSSGRRTNRSLSIALALGSVALLAGCGSEATGVTHDAGDPRLGAAMETLSADNGMSQNGMSQNGMSQNGMSQNGMSQNGFGTTAFQSWFNTDPALSDVVMKYVAKCAAADGTSYEWRNPSSGVTHRWSGLLGLAPGFAAGSAPTTAEKQLITACLAAHVNVYGVSVPISINGYRADGNSLGHAPDEWTTFPLDEGAFFGNVFDGQGVFVCQRHGTFTSDKSSVRACVQDTTVVGPSSQCAPLYNVGTCSEVCSSWSSTNKAYQSCTWNGVTYKPMSTRIRSQDVYTCGDGVCQVSEQCGFGTTAQSCRPDCGSCYD
jgi:hypothetical protein